MQVKFLFYLYLLLWFLITVISGVISLGFFVLLGLALKILQKYNVQKTWPVNTIIFGIIVEILLLLIVIYPYVR